MNYVMYGSVLLHVYCSYTLSPTGFHYGAFPLEPQDSGDEPYLLTESGTDDFIRTAFENGIVKAVKGKLPEKETFVYLVKKLQYDYPQQEAQGRSVYMNLAFEFGDKRDFLCFSTRFEQARGENNDQFYRKLADLIQPYNTPVYSLAVRRREMNAFIEEMLSCVSDSENEKAGSRTEITIISKTKNYSEDLQLLFHHAFKRSAQNEAVYYIVKKNRSSSRRIAFWVTAALILLILAILMGVRLLNQKEDTKPIATSRITVLSSSHTRKYLKT